MKLPHSKLWGMKNTCENLSQSCHPECMRTTIEISDELCRQLKRKAADEGVTIRQVVESALRVYLGTQTRRKGYELKWKTERGRILPGVRLDDRDALFDLMDGRR